ncbi:hypothetical protein [Cryptosporangium japonicum]|uniref:IPT/TIG domain-containing protein n=1 Tax=Cryptosporangium japonicum TaxID=80872 RepID=A0ABN0V737_9ACTN
MSFAHSRRLRRVVAPALAAAAASVVVSAILPPAAAQAAAITGTITVSSPTNAKVAALTNKQVVNLTVAGAAVPALSEDSVASVGLGGSPCDALTTYVVTSATTISIKTPATCPAGTGDIVITFANGDTLTKTGGITFVTPPAIEAVANRPLINDNSALLATANQSRRFGTSGGQTVRVKADPAFAFDPRSTSGLAVTLNGKAGTNVKVYADATSSTPITTVAGAISALNGNSLTFTTGLGMTAGDPVLTITQDGVSKTFQVAATGGAVVAAPIVTGLSVEAGRANQTNLATVISGTNLPKVLADANDSSKWLIRFCSATATATAANTTGTSLTVTVPNNLAGDAAGLGASTYSGTCSVTVTDVAASQTSAITAGSHYAVLAE